MLTSELQKLYVKDTNNPAERHIRLLASICVCENASCNVGVRQASISRVDMSDNIAIKSV